MGKTFIILGMVFIVIGLLWTFIGKLPGDITFKKGQTTIVVSLVLSFLLFIIGKFR